MRPLQEELQTHASLPMHQRPLEAPLTHTLWPRLPEKTQKDWTAVGAGTADSPEPANTSGNTERRNCLRGYLLYKRRQ